MRYSLTSLLGLCLLVAVTLPASASHLRAGEITARRVSSTSLTYEITFTGYFDIENGKPIADAQQEVLFYIDNAGPVRVARKVPVVNIGNGTTRNEYVFTYTFPTPGTFTISTAINARNANVNNLGGAASGGTEFFVRSTLVIDPALGLNHTPVLLSPPIDLAAVGQRYIHNPGAFDADGDSLAYRLAVPQKSNGRGTGEDIPAYAAPDQVPPGGTNEEGTSPATFTLDPLTGDLVWDAPLRPGFYNVAFVVEEWRNGVLIGEVVRDMQIIVIQSTNVRPRLGPLPDLCVQAGTLIQQRIEATDKDGDALNLTSLSGTYLKELVPAQNAEFLTTASTPGKTQAVFRWQTGCDHIRLEPYDVLVKVEDAPAPGTTNPSLFRKLVDIRTFKVRVYGPAPRNLRAEPVANAAQRSFRVRWDTYPCQVPGAQLVLYRKVGCADYPTEACQPGLPAGLGYQEIARLGVDETNFVDTNGSQGLEPGTLYSYRVLVLFPRPGTSVSDTNRLKGGGTSLPSAEFCSDFPRLTPLITHVTVDSTSQTRGVITLRWTRPAGQLPGTSPSQYRVFRATGLAGTDFTLIATLPTTLQPGARDTLLVDKGLNTTENAYRYRVDYYYPDGGSLTRLDGSEPASSVRLAQVPGTSRAVGLTWTANVPWDNTGQSHRVYREDRARPGTFNQIAEVNVTGFQTFTYTDDGADRYASDGLQSLTLSPDSTYCYRIETVGTYNSPRIRPALLYNFSQVLCVPPTDTTRPCPPQLTLDRPDCSTLKTDDYCGNSTFDNTLSWAYPPGTSPCERGIVAYRIHYTRYQDETPQYLASVPSSPVATTTYLHAGLTSFAGCYYVTAVNRFGRESAPSNLVCKDNCPQFALPNVFTPNNDGKNDEFTPLHCPAFVEEVSFVAFNRWGAKVFETTDPNLKWNGTSTSGQELPSGSYFYEASVRFHSVERTPEPLRYKGWVQLMR